jgi:hypothetical protein
MIRYPTYPASASVDLARFLTLSDSSLRETSEMADVELIVALNSNQLALAHARGEESNRMG